MGEIRKFKAKRELNDALNTRNGPSLTNTLGLKPGDQALVWREDKKRRWEGPYEVTNTSGTRITVRINDRMVIFRATMVKPFLAEDDASPVLPCPSDIDWTQKQRPNLLLRRKQSLDDPHGLTSPRYYTMWGESNSSLPPLHPWR